MGRLVTPATGTAFETRNVGVTVEAEVVLSEDLKFADVRIMPEHVADVERSTWGQGVSTLEMLTFETQRLSTGATVRIGEPFLLGTLNRPPVSKVDPDSANGVWFAFVTVDISK